MDQTEQARLDAAVATLKDLVGKWQAKFSATPPVPPAPADLSGLDAVVKSAQDLDAVIDPPTDEPPVITPPPAASEPAPTPAAAVTLLDANGNPVPPGA